MMNEFSKEMPNITIVIPTFNRLDYISRAIKYWDKSNFNIIIADGSETPLAHKLPITFNYLHDNKSTWFDRWKKAIALVTTEYVALCADDDFITFTGINNCVKYLENNLDYNSANGSFMSVTKHDNVITYNPIYEFNWGVDLSNEDPKERLIKSLNPFQILIYAVHRTDSLKKIFTEYKDYGNNAIIEFHVNMMSVLFGKHKNLSFLYSVRENVKGSSGSQVESIHTWSSNKKNIESMNNWKNNFVYYLNSEFKINKSISEWLFYEALKNYNAFVLKQGEKSNSTFFKLLKLLKIVTPNFVIKYRKTLLRKIKRNNIEFNSIMDLKSNDLVTLNYDLGNQEIIKDFTVLYHFEWVT